MTYAKRPVQVAAALGLIAATIALAIAPVRLAAQAPVDEATALHVRNGALALQRGKSDEAVREYTTALEDRTLPDDRRATILNDRGVAYVRLGQTREAIDDFNKAVELFPEYAATYNNRGNLLLALGLPKEALKDFNRAIVLAPGYAAAYNNRAGALMQIGNPQQAIRDFTQAVKLLPAAAAPLAGRGRAHMELGRPHAAIRDFSRAVGSEARFASGYRSRAEAKLKVGYYDEAIEDLSRAIAFDVNNADAHLLRGEAYLSSGNFEASIADFTRFAELRPEDAKGFEMRGLAHAMADVPEAALSDLNRAIELNQRSAIAFAYRAYAYARTGQPEIARSDIATAAKIAPEAAEVLWARAFTDETEGQTDTAIDTYRAALSARPNYKLALDALQRLGGGEAVKGDTVVEGFGTAGWQVVANNGAYFAILPEAPKLRVPLEMLGEGKPRLLSWEEKQRPFQQIGVLTYHSGIIEGASGPEEMEMAAIVDLKSASVVAIQPQRQGKQVATWNWSDNGTVTVASVDGVTDQFQLRQGIAPPSAAFAGRKTQRSRERRYGGTPSWAPWAEDGGFSFNNTGHGNRRKTSRKRQRKPKSIFDLLFN
ncbi:MAG: tetratricopeptide repeat protein [Alphaproteobacteria bacterium]|nr:tetratricopeptide repeat protein [Alphaproteobacteria bacterium]